MEGDDDQVRDVVVAPGAAGTVAVADDDPAVEI